MKLQAIIMAFVAICGSTAITSDASAASTFFNQAYSGGSPFSALAGGGVSLENFESGVLAAPGVSASGGSVISPGGVEAGGNAFSSGSGKKMQFSFANAGQTVGMAGFVLTHAQERAKVTMRAWDAQGRLIGRVRVKVSDIVSNGSIQNWFMGVNSDTGVSRIEIASNKAGFEIDHLQFAYGTTFAVVPLPPGVALGGLGLLGVMVVRRFKRKRSDHTS